MTPDDTRNVEVSRTKSTVPRPAAIPSERRGRAHPPIVEDDAVPVARAPKAGSLVSLALLVVAGAVLAGVLFTELVGPAISTLSDPAPTRWSGEGP